MADTVVSSIAVKQPGGGLIKETPVGTGSEHIYHVSIDGNTYTAKDIIQWIENYISDSRMTFVDKDNPVENGVPGKNVGIFVDMSDSAVIIES